MIFIKSLSLLMRKYQFSRILLLKKLKNVQNVTKMKLLLKFDQHHPKKLKLRRHKSRLKGKMTVSVLGWRWWWHWNQYGKQGKRDFLERKRGEMGKKRPWLGKAAERTWWKRGDGICSCGLKTLETFSMGTHKMTGRRDHMQHHL